MRATDGGSGDWRQWRRLQALRLKQQGWYQRDIAGALMVSEVSVSHWLSRARLGGARALLAHPPPGPASALSDEENHLDQAAQQAAAQQWSYTHFLGYLLDGEMKDRQRRGVEMSLKLARFPYLKRLEEFDLSAQPTIDKRLIDELAGLRFVEEGRNLVLLGPPGVGKTFLAIALGVRVCEMGQRAYFITAIDLARRLTKATAENRLHREIKNLVRPSLLIIDEVGYLTLDATQASLLFQVICQRYEKQQAIILTSNKAFADWAQVFAGDAIMASAALDRLLHRATVINIRGESFRLKERKRADSRDSQAASTGQTSRKPAAANREMEVSA